MKIQFNIQGKMTEDAGSAEILNCQEAFGTCMVKMWVTLQETRFRVN
jgi:hypothetical protein